MENKDSEYSRSYISEFLTYGLLWFMLWAVYREVWPSTKLSQEDLRSLAEYCIEEEWEECEGGRELTVMDIANMSKKSLLDLLDELYPPQPPDCQGKGCW